MYLELEAKLKNAIFTDASHMINWIRAIKSESELKWRNCIEAKGYTKKSRVGYPIGLGYPPDWGEQTYSLRPGDKTILQENMTIHMLAAIWTDDFGYEVSESVIVKENGCEPLSNVPRQLFVK